MSSLVACCADEVVEQLVADSLDLLFDGRGRLDAGDRVVGTGFDVGDQRLQVHLLSICH